MGIEEKLCCEIKRYSDVIIYGYADIGCTLLDYIIEFETSIKIANYSGRVKYFASSDKEHKSLRTEIKGIKIKSIYDLEEYKDTALVIIATQEQHHKAIANVLDELGFNNRFFILHEDYCMIKKVVEEHNILVSNNIQNYHLNHQMKLNALRDKVRRGSKVKVLFMTHDSSIFGSASVYRSMEKSDLFEPYIYVVSRRDVGYAEFMEEVNADINFFKDRGFRVISGYDNNGNPKDLHLINPDILFYDIPKLYGPAGAAYNRLDQLNWEYLTCYIPYGLLMVDSFYYHYHTKCIRETWKFFVDTNADFKRVLADGAFSAFNTVLGGYPKFDDYRKEEIRVPEKLDNENRTVIYAPHHSLFVSNNFGTFDLYKDFMLELVKNNPDINFVFKPHPLLPFQINARYEEGKINFSREDYEKYVETWANLPNGYVTTQGDYIDIFRRSCCMITDCGSFIGEYLPTSNPCIYLFNPRKNKQDEVYTPLAKKILDTYYIAKSQDELMGYVKTVIMDSSDMKKQNRVELINEEFSNIGKAGEFITEYLTNAII